VLPLPAPARISSGPSKCVTASCWAGVRSASSSSVAPGDGPRPCDIVDSPQAVSFRVRHCTGGTGAGRGASPIMPDIGGSGTDSVECVRIRKMIDRHGELFLARVFTDREVLYCQRSKTATEHFAGRWAAKEAVLKCLGTGWSKGLCWTDIEVCNEPNGRPRIQLHAATRDFADKLGVATILISIS